MKCSRDGSGCRANASTGSCGGVDGGVRVPLFVT